MNVPYFVYQWCTDDSSQAIRAYAITAQNETVEIVVPDFSPYAFLELPPNFISDRLSLRNLMNFLISGRGKRENWPIGVVQCTRKKLYYADVEEVKKEDGTKVYPKRLFPYIRLIFETQGERAAFARIVNTYGLQFGYTNRELQYKPYFKVHEHNAPSHLQLASQRQINMIGWIDIDMSNARMFEPSPGCDKTFSTSFTDIHQCKDDAVLRTVPTPRVLMFDCEVFSSVSSAMPNSSKPTDVVFQISIVYSGPGKDENIEKRNILISLAPEEGVDMDILTSSSTVDVEFVRAKNERMLLLEFHRLVHELNPHVIGGYNITGWDFEYLFDRAKYLGIDHEFTRLSMTGAECKITKLKFESSAYGQSTSVFPDMKGRVLLDMLPIIRRDYKFDRYDLRSVSTRILGKSKDPLKASGIFKCYRIFKPRELAICGKYCLQDSVVVMELFDKLKSWVNVTHLSNAYYVQIMDSYLRGQQIRIFSQIYKYCTLTGVVVEYKASRAKPGEKYTGALVLDPEPGFYERVCTFDFASLYPSVIISYNLDFSTLVDDDTEEGRQIPDEWCYIFEWEDHLGCEHDKTRRKTRVKQENVLCARRKYRYLKQKYCKGIVPTILETLLSERRETRKVLGEVEARIQNGDYANDREKKELELYASILDVKQLALKTNANSVYGATGAVHGMLPCMPTAMCTTTAGREALRRVKSWFERECKGSEIIYGDTDSVMVVFKEHAHLSHSELEEYCKGVGNEISKMFAEPMKLEFENLATKFLIFSKKRYISMLSNGKRKQRGLITVRRDNAEVWRAVYTKTIDYVFSGKGWKDVEEMLVEEIKTMFSHAKGVKYYSITKSVKSINSYKTRSLPDPDHDPKKFKEKLREKQLERIYEKYGFDIANMVFERSTLPDHIQLAIKMQSRGAIVETGSRLSYAMVTSRKEINPDELKLSLNSQRIEDTEYYSANADIHALDMRWYFTRLRTGIETILDLVFKEESKEFFDAIEKTLFAREKLLIDLQRAFSPELRIKDGAIVIRV